MVPALLQGRIEAEGTQGEKDPFLKHSFLENPGLMASPGPSGFVGGNGGDGPG